METSRPIQQLNELLKKYKTPVVIAAIVLCCACTVMVSVVDSGLQQAGIIPTRPSPTQYVNSFTLTMTAEAAKPTNTPPPTWTPAPTHTPERLAWTACTSFIENELKLSSWDAQKYNPAGVIKADDNYLVDVYYATNDVTYTCLLQRDPNGDWRILNLEKK